MRFRPSSRSSSRLAIIAVAAWASCVFAAQSTETAVVPKQVIYPGETIAANQIDVVTVTNPNIAGGYARIAEEVVGRVAKRTLLPGRTIPVNGLREAYAIKRGANVRLTFAIGNMVISAAGTPLTDAMVGDLIKVRNTDSGSIVSGTVMADGTVQVMAK
ncbi:flagellar basal body P-ring formation chaperone FlgA [Peteryoungia ipomoeae]|uniref:Flagella basal body P-ring formation protein FlgA n=1 Tax=Peteryoungia ipomoeae TaxID=1210932 RepID=A0A4S8P136_9HYPH|nr:flagellar basal body P-ring formation chaperone FlgA [Peteryoungia ipomoeae]THV23707.1 flagellar basal body P-ring formation protein FlgA [Peteryoungia ipomoeae]